MAQSLRGMRDGINNRGLGCPSPTSQINIHQPIKHHETICLVSNYSLPHYLPIITIMLSSHPLLKIKINK